MTFDDKCHRCLEQRVPAGHYELKTYEVTGKTQDGGSITLLYNVSAAYDYAKGRIKPIAVPYDKACDLIITNLSETFCGAHVEHVDRSIPAMIGMHSQKLLLMDGTHRMFARIKYGEDPLAYVLTEEQTKLFLIQEEVKK